MPFLQLGESVTVSVPSGQRIIVGALRGAAANVLIPQGLSGGPISTVADTSQTFGPWTGQVVSVTVMVVKGESEYVVGASPALTDATYAAGAVAITGGTINGASVGATTASTVRYSTLAAGTYTDSTGTPGNVTNNSARGRAAIAAAGTTCVVTNSLVTATSSVFIQERAQDATATRLSVTTAAGSFTVTANAAATAALAFDFLVVL